MTISNPSVPSNPNFTDSFERELANDLAYNLGRREPSALKPALMRLGKDVVALVGAGRKRFGMPRPGH